ncbi:MAG TPA: hypothetical protein VHU83_00355 [Bryobacteraceae bacterium]|jgi:hypothetical protein|nr:hypothetical protein [Bryobacteraceae bacterium]
MKTTLTMRSFTITASVIVVGAICCPPVHAQEEGVGGTYIYSSSTTLITNTLLDWTYVIPFKAASSDPAPPRRTRSAI